MRIISAISRVVKDLGEIHDEIGPEYKNRIRTVSAELNRIKEEHRTIKVT